MENENDIDFGNEGVARIDSVAQGLPATASEYHDFVESVVSLVNEGFISPLRVLHTLKTMSNLHDDIKDRIMSSCLHDYQLHREKGNTVNFGMYEIKEESVGVRYDYSNDLFWVNLKTEIERLKKLHGITDLENKLKAREEILRSVGKGNGGLVYDTDEITGEVFLRQAPMMTSGKTSLKFHRRKKD